MRDIRCEAAELGIVSAEHPSIIDAGLSTLAPYVESMMGTLDVNDAKNALIGFCHPQAT